ncbi:MAG: hypothetical protein ABIL09_02385, partial [Gemmatimonadota bacterium]
EIVDGEDDLPPMPAPTTTLQVISEDGRRIVNHELPVGEDRLGTFARGVLAGKPLTQREWSRPGSPLSRGQFEEVRDFMLQRGYAVWRDESKPQLGIELTEKGRAALERIAYPAGREQE